MCRPSPKNVVEIWERQASPLGLASQPSLISGGSHLHQDMPTFHLTQLSTLPLDSKMLINSSVLVAILKQPLDSKGVAGEILNISPQTSRHVKTSMPRAEWFVSILLIIGKTNNVIKPTQ
jgi:hypothetical protein